MATTGSAPQTSSLQVNIFDGTRQPIGADVDVLFTITDGNQRQIFHRYEQSMTNFKVPFYDNLGDNYTAVAFAQDYGQAGFSPVKCSQETPQSLDLMLLKKTAGFNFASAGWDALAASRPQLSALLAHGAADAAAARDRYTQLMETRAPVLACLFNITTAMAAIHLPVGTPLDYFKELIWDDTMAQDRFYGWADPALYNQVKQAAAQGEFWPSSIRHT